MTQRMAVAREAFEAMTGDVTVLGATYTWDALPSGHAELAFLVRVDEQSALIVAVQIPPSSDVVRAAAALGSTFAEAAGRNLASADGFNG